MDYVSETFNAQAKFCYEIKFEYIAVYALKQSWVEDSSCLCIRWGTFI